MRRICTNPVDRHQHDSKGRSGNVCERRGADPLRGQSPPALGVYAKLLWVYKLGVTSIISGASFRLTVTEGPETEAIGVVPELMGS